MLGVDSRVFDRRELCKARHIVLVALATVITLTSAAVARPDAATHFSDWAPAQKIDEIAGNSSELNTTSLDGCPIQSPDGLSLYMASNRPGGRAGSTSGSPAGEHGRSVGRSREPRRAGQLGGGRLLPDARSAGRASSSSAGRRCRGAADWGTSTSRARIAGRLERAAAARVRARRARTARSTSRGLVRRGRRARASSTSRAAPRPSPGDIFVSKRRRGGGFGPASAVAELNDAGGERHPAERAQGRARDRLQLESCRRRSAARTSGSRSAESCTSSWSAAGQSRPRREHRRERDTPVALVGCRSAPLRARARARGHERHLRDHAEEG